MTPPLDGLPPPPAAEPAYLDACGLWRGPCESKPLVDMKPKLSAWQRAYQRRRERLAEEWRRVSDAIYAEAEAAGRNATPASDAAEGR